MYVGIDHASEEYDPRQRAKNIESHVAISSGQLKSIVQCGPSFRPACDIHTKKNMLWNTMHALLATASTSYWMGSTC